MQIISQPQPNSQKDKGYSKIAKSLESLIPFLSRLAIPPGISVLFVGIPHCKNEQKKDTAEEIIIHHSYHN